MPIVRNVLSVIAGFLFGSLVNMGIIMISASIIPPPEGVDLSTTESMKAGMHLFEPKHFLLPFLAHAIGTFAGAILAGFVASTHKMIFSMSMGALFLAGGIAAVSMLPSPLWFSITDLALAYIPTAYLAGKIARRSGEVL